VKGGPDEEAKEAEKINGRKPGREKRELEALSHSLKFQEEKKKQELEALRDELKIAEKKKKRELDTLRRDYDQMAARATTALTEKQSVASWMNTRAVLAAKLRKSRQKLLQDKQTLAGAKKRKEVIEDKFRKLLGVDDPDGTGSFAKFVVLAEIDEIEGKGDGDALKQIELEQEFNQELTEQILALDKSIHEFNAYRNEAMSALNEELMECSQNGYLKLLHDEMNHLQVALSRQ
jgi:hypothetical protein